MFSFGLGLGRVLPMDFGIFGPGGGGALRNLFRCEFHCDDSDLGPEVRVTGQKSELQAENLSYNWTDPQNPNGIAQKTYPNRVWVLLQEPPLKPS